MIKNLYINSVNKQINKKQVHKLVKSLQQELKFTIDSLFINFIDSKRIKKINLEYLKHNYPTDVISFNYTGGTEKIDGEIFISIDDATEYAKKYKVTLNSELKRLVIHGVLHLKGFNDNDKISRSRMRKLENNLLNKNNFTLLQAE